MKKQAEELLRALPGVSRVEVEMTAEVDGAGRPAARRSRPSIKHIVAVSSGKGGVGKSTVAGQPRRARSRAPARASACSTATSTARTSR